MPTQQYVPDLSVQNDFKPKFNDSNVLLNKSAACQQHIFLRFERENVAQVPYPPFPLAVGINLSLAPSASSSNNSLCI
jgi:hypothetical protein